MKEDHGHIHFGKFYPPVPIFHKIFFKLCFENLISILAWSKRLLVTVSGKCLRHLPFDSDKECTSFVKCVRRSRNEEKKLSVLKARQGSFSTFSLPFPRWAISYILILFQTRLNNYLRHHPKSLETYLTLGGEVQSTRTFFRAGLLNFQIGNSHFY